MTGRIGQNSISKVLINRRRLVDIILIMYRFCAAKDQSSIENVSELSHLICGIS